MKNLSYFISTLDKSPWRHIYRGAFSYPTYNSNTNTVSAGAIQFIFEPYKGNAVVSHNGKWLKPEKFAAIYNWYHNADPKDASITKYFKEYSSCIDVAHNIFRSNYGVYVYGQGMLDDCAKELTRNANSRRACIVINDRNIMLNDGEIDKLCTNAIHFFIRNGYLRCVVQMRSSNMVTLLPYDIFMFSIFMAELWQKLHSTCYGKLVPGSMTVQIADAHITLDDLPGYCMSGKAVIRTDERLNRISTDVISMFNDDSYKSTIPSFIN